MLHGEGVIVGHNPFGSLLNIHARDGNLTVVNRKVNATNDSSDFWINLKLCNILVLKMLTWLIILWVTQSASDSLEAI